jgi:hypothetical protein
MARHPFSLPLVAGLCILVFLADLGGILNSWVAQ